MRAELVLMGRRVDMARRARRRGLVVAMYAVMAGLLVGTWFVDHWRSTGIYVFWAGITACRILLGGYYRGGLVKPFQNRPPRVEEAAPSLLAVGLRVYNPLPQDDRPFLNDERELAQRDRAHYSAYQTLAVAIVVVWGMLYVRMVRPAWMSWMGMTVDAVFYGLMLVVLMMTFTLPQAILLWTEPDMEEA